MSIKTRVKERDNYTCQKCGHKPSSDPSTRIEAHHIVPSAFGGADSTDNLLSLCKTCHASAPTEVVPKSIIDGEKKVSEISVNDNNELREYFESTFDAYVRTGVPPTTDLMIFGMMYMEKESKEEADLFKEVSSGSDLFKMLDDLSDKFEDLNRQLRNRESSWIMAARISGYLDLDQSTSDILTGRDGQLRFDLNS